MQTDPRRIRNFTVAGHSGSGKTSICDLMLFKSGIIEKKCSVGNKNSVSDFMPDEKDKLSSIHASPLHCEWKKTDLYFVDTPGYGEFIGETTASLSASDNVLLTINAENGIEIGFTRANKLANKLGLPRFICINGMDRSRADFNKVLEQLQEVYGRNTCVPVVLPVGSGDSFESVFHVLKGENPPDEIAEDVEQYKEQLMDTVAESDEELMEKYFEGEDLSEEEISKGLHEAIHSGHLVPVFVCSAEKDIGTEQLMNGIVNLFIDPLGREKIKTADDSEMEIAESGNGVAQVFKSVMDPFIGHMIYFRVFNGKLKSDSELVNVSNGNKERFGTILRINGKEQEKISELPAGGIGAIAKLKSTHIGDTLSENSDTPEIKAIEFPQPIMTYAVYSVKSGEEEKIANGFHRFLESDPTFKLERYEETHELLISGMGDQHINNMVKKLKESSSVEVDLRSPKIPYRETITSKGKGHYRHKKQTGGHGQFAEVYLSVEPADEYEFVNKVVGGNIPKNFIPAVEKGIKEAMVEGPLAGCVVENIRVTVYDGKHHDVDSSEMAFKIASRTAFKGAMKNSKPILLEPTMSLKVTIPDEYMGDISGDLNHKRGRILGMNIDEGLQVVKAEVPQSETAKYATELRSMTHGKGSFEMHFERYDRVPSNIANKIISEYEASQDESSD